MATQLQLRRGTTSENASFTGAVGEVTVDTTKDTLIVQDGSTAGGHELAKADGTNISFGDNVKATFGASDDLQIFHDPAAGSVIQEGGAGSLFIRASSNIQLEGVNGENMAIFNENGSVQLYNDNAQKLATTATGIDVTGTATMDGLTVDASSAELQKNTGATFVIGTKDTPGSSSSPIYTDLKFEGWNNRTNSLLRSWDEANSTGFGRLEVHTNDNASLKRRALFDYNGDISFYEDTGTTAKLFWDASAERLGIGTSSPSELLHVSGGKALIDITSSVGSYLTFKNYGVNQFSANKNYHEINFITSNVSSETNGGYVRIKAGQEVSGNNNSSYLGFWTAPNVGNVAEAMRIDSAGNVGIGTTSPNLHNWTKAVTLNTSSNGGYEIGQSGTKYGAFALQGDGRVQLTNFTANPLTFQTSNTERMRIDSAGNVGIGVSSPSYPLQVGDGSDALETINIRASDTGQSRLFFSDLASNGQGRLTYDHANNSLQVFTADTERMRIDSSGNLLVGTTSTNFADQGVIITDGQYIGTMTNSHCSTFNRLSSDGDIQRFFKDGTTVGSIGNRFGAMYVHSPDGTNGAGLRFFDGVIQPCESNGNDSNGDTDLGQTNSRFKDLHLSGGVYLGGTGAANKLDDYEEGTWAPAFNGPSAVTYTQQSGRYTKVGREVHVQAVIRWSALTAGVSNVSLGGLPFSLGGTDNFINTLDVTYANNTNFTYINEYLSGGTMFFYNGASAHGAASTNPYGSSGTILINGTFYTS